jgi:hypothetical protein
MGCLFFELLSMKEFDVRNVKKIIFDKRYHPEFTNLVLEMLDVNPKKRPSIEKIVERIKKFKPNSKWKFEMISEDLDLNICSFLKPLDVLNLTLLNKSMQSKYSSDLIWKFLIENFSYYPPNVILKEFCVESYKELYLLKPWSFSKNFSKGIKFDKSNNTIENISPIQKHVQLKFAKTNESLKKGKYLIRIRNECAIRGSSVGIISEKNLKEAMESENEHKINYIQYMRDGSVSGLGKQWRENIDRIRLVSQDKLMRVYFKFSDGDILSVLLNYDEAIVQFYVNNDFENSLLTIKNVQEMKLNSPVFLIFTTSPNQKFKLLKNIKSDLDSSVNPVVSTCSA